MLLEVDFEDPGEGGFGEKVRAVVHAVKFVVLFFNILLVDFLAFFDLNAKFKAELIQFFELVLFAHHLMEGVLLDFDVRHGKVNIFKNYIFSPTYFLYICINTNFHTVEINMSMEKSLLIPKIKKKTILTKVLVQPQSIAKPLPATSLPELTYDSIIISLTPT